MAITEIEFVNGLFSLIYCIVATLVGLRIASRYFKVKNRIILLMGIAWTILAFPWWPSAISFVLALVTGEGLPFQLYVLIGNVLVPVYMICLLMAFTDMKYQRAQKIILVIFFIIGVLFWIYFFYFLVVDPSVHGELKGIVDIEYAGILRYYLIFTILLNLIIGIYISLQLIKSEEQERKLKGKFLLLAYVVFTIGAILDAAVTLTTLTLPIVRVVMIFSSVLFYFGFILPEWMKRLFIKE